MQPELVPHRGLSLSVSLTGRMVRSITLDQPVITIGRDPESDVCIDNPGISRQHLRIERTASGVYEVVDLGTANGSLLNDEPLIGRVPISDGDHLGIGKFLITAHYEHEHEASPVTAAPPFADQHTTVLSQEDLAKVLQLHKRAEAQPPPPPAVSASGAAAPSAGKLVPVALVVAWSLAAFAGGVVTGMLITLASTP